MSRRDEGASWDEAAIDRWAARAVAMIESGEAKSLGHATLGAAVDACWELDVLAPPSEIRGAVLSLVATHLCDGPRLSYAQVMGAEGAALAAEVAAEVAS